MTVIGTRGGCSLGYKNPMNCFITACFSTLHPPSLDHCSHVFISISILLVVASSQLSRVCNLDGLFSCTQDGQSRSLISRNVAIALCALAVVDHRKKQTFCEQFDFAVRVVAVLEEKNLLTLTTGFRFRSDGDSLMRVVEVHHSL